MQKFQFGKLFATIQQKNKQKFNTFINDIQSKSLPSYFIPRKQTPINHLKPQFIDSPSKTLINRKKTLLKQLKTIETQLKKVSNSSVHSSSRTKKLESSEDYERASQLIIKMNKQRKEKQDRNRKKTQNIQLQVQKSLKKIQLYKQQAEKKRQQKKKEIQDRINIRRQALKMKKDHDKKANHLIQQLQGYRVSLPNIKTIKNPQQNSERMKEAKTLKRYRKSPFLQNVQQEQLNKKRQLYLKEYEKKHKRQRQQIYGRKLRKSRVVKQDSSTFVT